MSWLKRIFYALLALIVLAIVLLFATGNGHVVYGIRKTYLLGKTKPDIDDMKYFDVSTMAADHPEAWPMHRRYNLMSIPQQYIPLIDSLQTTAFLVFKNDSLLFEKYWEHTDENTVSNSFSMAKSFTAMLIGKAVDEGYIKSLDQPVGDFIPEYSKGKEAAITIRHLMQMASGIPFEESYTSPFSYMARAYYGKDVVKATLKFHADKAPGTFWTYEGGNTVLLGMIIKKATGRTPSEYFFQKIWSCIGAEHPAYWNLDREGGMEKTFSGFYATARDFARIGKLYLHDGVWENDTILSPGFVKDCITPNNIPDIDGDKCTWYGLHWWLGQNKGEPFYSCRGLRGQYIIVVPGQDLVVVRLGHLQNREREAHMATDMFMYLDIAKGMDTE